MIDVCFWCNRAKSGEKEGQPTYNDYEYCPTCSAICAQGISIIQVVSESNGNPPIRDGLYPTGKWAVVSEENITKVLTNGSILDTVLEIRQMYVNKGEWEILNLP